MPRTIRFHLDEHVHSAVADGLRRRGIDVTTTAEANLLGTDDQDHIAFALESGRVLFSHDADFLRLHQQSTPHAGIVYCHQQEQPVGAIIRGMELIWEVLEPEEMRDRIEFL